MCFLVILFDSSSRTIFVIEKARNQLNLKTVSKQKISVCQSSRPPQPPPPTPQPIKRKICYFSKLKAKYFLSQYSEAIWTCSKI